jgi:hypothetical protein
VTVWGICPLFCQITVLPFGMVRLAGSNRFASVSVTTNVPAVCGESGALCPAAVGTAVGTAPAEAVSLHAVTRSKVAHVTANTVKRRNAFALCESSVAVRWIVALSSRHLVTECLQSRIGGRQYARIGLCLGCVSDVRRAPGYPERPSRTYTIRMSATSAQRAK